MLPFGNLFLEFLKLCLLFLTDFQRLMKAIFDFIVIHWWRHWTNYSIAIFVRKSALIGRNLCRFGKKLPWLEWSNAITFEGICIHALTWKLLIYLFILVTHNKISGDIEELCFTGFVKEVDFELQGLASLFLHFLRQLKRFFGLFPPPFLFRH